MIKKRYIVIPLVVLSIGVLIIVAIGYLLFLRNTDNHDEVFAATAVGTPTGPPVSRTLGPEGGSISSSDGKLTINVPVNAVAGNMQFSIQPITNMAKDGIGSGYRLEPGDKTFPVPIDLTIHFDDRDLEGTVVEALQLAYQDKDGSWHAETNTKLNEQEKTLTVSTTHFSDWLYMRTLGITPPEAKVLVGDAVTIKVDSCAERHPLVKYNIAKYLLKTHCYAVPSDASTWELKGAGKLTRINASTVVYTAPPVKPADNHARVIVDIDISRRDDSTGKVKTYTKEFESLITIVDRGYRASGQDGLISYSGVVCDLAAPFAVTTTMGPVTFQTKFEPDNATSGIATWGATYGPRGMGNGPYTVTGDASEYQITVHVNSVLTLAGKQAGGSGDAHIILTPLDGNECSEKK